MIGSLMCECWFHRCSEFTLSAFSAFGSWHRMLKAVIGHAESKVGFVRIADLHQGRDQQRWCKRSPTQRYDHEKRDAQMDVPFV